MKLLILLTLFSSCALLPTNIIKQYQYEGVKTFNGKDQKVVIKDNKSAELKNTNKASVAAWIYPTCTKCDHEIFAISTANKDKNLSSASRLALRTGKSGKLIVMARSIDEPTNAMIALSTPKNFIEMNKWSHVAAIVHYDENRFQMFINGEEIETTWNKEVKFQSARTPNTPPENIVIGSEDDSKSNFYEGKITHPLIIDKALSSSNIEKLFNDKPE
jgi:hypothetical protein